MWGHGKFRAVKEWADEQRRRRSSDSYAYSDSYYDVPLLNAVGHPVRGQPRPPHAAAGAGPPLADASTSTCRRACPSWSASSPSRLLFPFVRPELAPYVTLDIDGVEHIPLEGPAIICANHRSYFDVAARRLRLAKRGRPVRFLGKKEVFDAPIVGDLARAMGGIRVERGTGSDEPLKEAARRARGRRDGGAHAAGHDPAGPRRSSTRC